MTPLPQLADWPRWVENACTDWDGSAMPDEGEPRVIPTCGELRALIAEQDALRADAQRYRLVRVVGCSIFGAVDIAHEALDEALDNVLRCTHHKEQT